MTQQNNKKIVISSIDEKVCATCDLPKGKGEAGEVCACVILDGLPLLCELSENS